MGKTYVGLVVLFFLSCSADVKKESLSNMNKTEKRGLVIEMSNIQENSHVVQNDAININDNGVIHIGK